MQNLQLETLRPFGCPIHSDLDNELPFLGYVPAGALREPCEIAERVDLTAFLPSHDVFVVRVAGDSMIEASILHNDWVVVKQTPVAKPGRIVVAITEAGEVTLKFWFPENGRIRLEPANAKYHPIFVASAQVKGVVVGVFRVLAE